MKLSEKSTLLLLITLSFQLCQFRELKNHEVGEDCAIPNQNKTRGICLQRRDCAEYEELFNVTDLGVERLSFIINLDCGFDYDSWKSLVCCPKPESIYKYILFNLYTKIIFIIYFRKPDLTHDPLNVKIRDTAENGSIILDNRFNENENAQIKCGQQLDNRIVGGEICEIDKLF